MRSDNWKRKPHVVFSWKIKPGVVNKVKSKLYLKGLRELLEKLDQNLSSRSSQLSELKKRKREKKKGEKVSVDLQVSDQVAIAFSYDWLRGWRELS